MKENIVAITVRQCDNHYSALFEGDEESIVTTGESEEAAIKSLIAQLGNPAVVLIFSAINQGGSGNFTKQIESTS